MGAVGEDTCPVCNQGTLGSARVGCARCWAYHHASCWTATGACGTCGVEETLEEQGRCSDAEHGDRKRRLLLVGGFGGVVVTVLVAGALVVEVALDPGPRPGHILARWHHVLELLVGLGASISALVAGRRRGP